MRAARRLRLVRAVWPLSSHARTPFLHAVPSAICRQAARRPPARQPDCVYHSCLCRWAAPPPIRPARSVAPFLRGCGLPGPQVQKLLAGLLREEAAARPAWAAALVEAEAAQRRLFASTEDLARVRALPSQRAPTAPQSPACLGCPCHHRAAHSNAALAVWRRGSCGLTRCSPVRPGCRGCRDGLRAHGRLARAAASRGGGHTRTGRGGAGDIGAGSPAEARTRRRSTCVR